ncbi:MAG: succinylglutamate desuccinylase/aspartoacylase family protein [Pollutimonas bauzanensis]
MSDLARLATPVVSEVDFDAEGKFHGFLRIPHSVHRSAYGWLPFPVASIRRGSGPTVVIMAGNHGDEYEGQIIVSRLMREIEPDMLNGQLILLPMANYPAALAGLRTSPLDGGNLNRSFPGDPSGGPTNVIAHYIENALAPRSDLIVDLHSGGSSLLYHGSTLMTAEPRDEAEALRIFRWIKAFGLDRACLRAAPNPVTIGAAARRQGSVAFLAELGGAGMVTPAVLQSAWQSVNSLLAEVGVLRAGPLAGSGGPPALTRLMRIDGDSHHVYALGDGIFEPLVELGASVAAGQAAALLHDPENPQREPAAYYFAGAGQVICKRVPARARRGDCLFQLAHARPGPQLD